MRRAALVMLAVVGCRRPYQAEATAIDGGRYMIRAESEASESEARQRAFARANQLCASGYEVADDKAGASRTRERVAVFGHRDVVTPEVTLVVRCTGGTGGGAR
jgi:hypothetical protein